MWWQRDIHKSRGGERGEDERESERDWGERVNEGVRGTYIIIERGRWRKVWRWELEDEREGRRKRGTYMKI